MRATRTLAILGAAALVVGACGEASPGDDPGAQEQIAELEDELDEARADAEELLADNERLAEEIRELTADSDDAPDDGSDAGDEPASGDPDEDAPPAASPGEPAPIHSPEGLNQQLRTLFDLDDGPDGAWNPGATPWESTDPPAGLADSYDTPGALAFDLAAALDADALGMESWETTTRVLIDDEDPDLAYVAVLSWGWGDDAGAGSDLRMTITRSDGTWSPGGAEVRFHCRRGVTDDGLCV